MATGQPAVQAIVWDFEVRIDERDMESDAYIKEAVDSTDDAGAIDTDRLVAGLNQERARLPLLLEQYIGEVSRQRGFDLEIRTDERILRAFRNSQWVVTDLRFARGSLEVLGRATVILSDPIVQEIAKDALIAIGAKWLQRGLMAAADPLLGRFGIQLKKPVGNVQVINVTGSGANVTINPPQGAPEPTPAASVLKIPSLGTLVRLNAMNLVISLAVLLALIAYILRLVP